MTALGPLAGVRVIDFTRVFSGPYATQILGDLGADVIKIERVDGGDEARDYGLSEGMVRPGAAFLAYNRNKRSVGIDLKTPEGIDIVRSLLRSGDVLVHNYRPGVMERLGLSYDEVSALNMGIIYCSISGFGARSPLQSRGANDLSIQAYSGLLSITGEENGGPVRNPTSICDLTAGLYAAVGIISALYSRTGTGVGQEVATSMLEGQLSMMGNFLVDYWMNGHVPGRMGTGNEHGLPNQAFPTSDGWICITAGNESLWRRCCDSLGVSLLADDPRFRTLRDRYANRAELITSLSEATRRLTTEQCLIELSNQGVPCAPVNSIPDIGEDPLLEALGATVDMEVMGRSSVRLVQSPLKLSSTPVTAKLPPPELGEHTDAVLVSIGYTRSDIDRLRSSGAVV